MELVLISAGSPVDAEVFLRRTAVGLTTMSTIAGAAVATANTAAPTLAVEITTVGEPRARGERT